MSTEGSQGSQGSQDALAHALETSFGASGPSCWGPVQWMALHQLARGYPRANPSEAQKAALVSYVTALADLLPCEHCSKHWRALSSSVVGSTGSRYDALKWTIDAHNAVNARLHKKVLSYEEAVRDMEDRCPGNRFAGVFGPPVEAAPLHTPADRMGLKVACGVLGVLLLAIIGAFIAYALLHENKGKFRQASPHKG